MNRYTDIMMNVGSDGLWTSSYYYLFREYATESRKEKSRDAARNRRALESDYFQVSINKDESSRGAV